MGDRRGQYPRELRERAVRLVLESREGVRRGRRHRTSMSDPAAARAADLVQRRFSPERPDRLWVTDFT